MKYLTTKGLFLEMRDVWTLGAALGIVHGKTLEQEKQGKRGTFQRTNSLDPDGILSSVMLALFPELDPKEMSEKLVDFAEWGIREIERQERNGTLDFSKLAEMPFKKQQIGHIQEDNSKDEPSIKNLISKGETGNIEFKASMLWDYKEERSNKTMAFEVAVTLCAFLNSNGGYLLIGVKDDKTILGLEKDFKLIKKPDKLNTDLFRLRFASIIEKHLEKLTTEHIHLSFDEIEGKTIAIAHVPRRAPKEVFICNSPGANPDFYIRLGNASHRLNKKETIEYIKQHW